MRKTIFDTPFAKASSLRSLAMKGFEYLVRNMKTVMLSEQDTKNLASIRAYSTTPLSDIFEHAAEAKKLSACLFLDLARYEDDVPEIITINDIAVDGKIVSSTIVDELAKVWINLTPIAGRRASPANPLPIKDIPKLHELVTRALLCVTYHDNDSWLTPKLNTFIIESYSMTITKLLQRSFNLDPEEFVFVQTLFALYCAQMLTSEERDLENPPILHRCTFLGSTANIQNKINAVWDVIDDKNLTLESIVKALREKGPSRMSKLGVDLIYRMFSAGSAESQALIIAVDYPPYWVLQILKYMSGSKNPVFNSAFKISDLKRKAAAFAVELNTTPTFINKVNR